MDQADFKYDVAFSFLAEDEALAIELNDLIQDRLSTFLYSKKQEELAGTDGEETFNAVFCEQARLVVVIYRNGWGQTPWTRIEQTAIRNRAYEEGYSFVVFIPLDKHPSVPNWLPKTQLWIGLNRWGIPGAASVIEARVQQLGGFLHEESVEARAKRLERTLNFKENREQFLNSREGVNWSEKAFNSLCDELEGLLKVIEATTDALNLTTKRVRHKIVLLGPHTGLSVNWRSRYYDSLKDSKLEVALWEGHPPFPGIIHIEEPMRRNSLTFQFDLLRPETAGWKSVHQSERVFDSKALAEFIIKFYMDDADPKR